MHKRKGIVASSLQMPPFAAAVLLLSPLFLLFFRPFPAIKNLTSRPEDIRVTATRVADILPGSGGSYPGDFAAIGDTLFFRANDGTHGYELWKTSSPYDAAHTKLVADIRPGSDSSFPEELSVIDDVLFFRADNGISGQELWKCEPPYERAYQVADINPGANDASPTEFLKIGNTLFFQADGGNGAELWKTFPPYNTAVQVADIWPGPGSSSPRHLTSIGWILFFSADDSSGRELWKSEPPYDFTSTVRVKDIFLGGSADPDELLRVGTTLFFTAYDEAGKREIWRTNPPYDQYSTERANEIKTMYPTLATDLAAIGETVFFTGTLSLSGFELRKIVPPYTSTQISGVMDIYEGFTGPFPNSSFPADKTPVGSTLFFTANDGLHGIELWGSVPPYTSAFLAKDINHGSASSAPRELTPIGTSLYFTAVDSNGRQIWRTSPPYDENSVVRVTDFNLPSTSSEPNRLFALGRTLFFTVSDEYGNELWKMEADSPALPATGFAPGKITRLAPPPREDMYTLVSDMQLAIPALGVRVPLVGVPVSDTGWDVAWLGQQAGYLIDTAFPTFPGNTVIAAHAYLPDGNPGPFANLQRLRWGDQINIYAWGRIYTYEVRESRRIAPEDTSVMKHEEYSWLTLITCQGFDEESGSYRWRYVVRAVLTQVTN